MKLVLLLLLLFGTALASESWSDATSHLSEQERNAVEEVHVVSMNHLDVGFTKPAYVVINQYFEEYFPLAVATAEEARLVHGESFVYTTHSWLVSFYLNCPDNGKFKCPAKWVRDLFVDAVKRGDIAIHAFPFNAEPEVYDSSLFAAGIELTKDVSAELGVPFPKTLSQRDVPGMSRSVIPILARSGIKAITVGVNGASAPPVVPGGFNTVFRWQEPNTGSEVMATWHANGYGGIGTKDVITAPNVTHALAVDFKNDNAGPQNIVEVIENLHQLRKEFPNANVHASTFDAFFDMVQPDLLPTTSEEIGDTWVYGCGSDPHKYAALRIAQQARSGCLDAGQCSESDPAFRDFTRHLLKLGEHTWGVHVVGQIDLTNWANDKFEAARSDKSYTFLEEEWRSQRSWLDDGIATLDKTMPDFAAELRGQLANMTATKPSIEGYSEIATGQPCAVTPEKTIVVDGATGALTGLEVSGTQWAAPDKPIGQFLYQTHSAADFQKLVCEGYAYTYPNCWADFMKPGMGDAVPTPQHKTWPPDKVTAFTKHSGAVCSLLIKLEMPQYPVTYSGSPREVWIEWTFENGTAEMGVEVQWFNKTATRLAESIWLVFNPDVADSSVWRMDKLGLMVDPADVMKNGSTHLHAVDGGVVYNDGLHTMGIETIDAGLVSPGSPLAFPGDFTLPDMERGMAFNLENNIWDTNYIMWYPFNGASPDSKFRFNIVLS